VEETLGNIKDEAFRSLEEYGGKLCVVLSGDIPRGISGLAAVRLLQMCKVTSIAGAIMEDGTVSGSIRTAPGVNAPGFLGNFADLFVNYGGHPGAGGFSLEGDKTGEFLERLKALAPSLEKSEQEEETVTIDAEIPHAYMKPDKLLFYVDAFEPFGAENPELRFLVRNAKVMGAEIIGKTEKKHLRLDLKAGEFTWPARFWNAADRYGADFAKGDRVDAVFAIERNFYGGEEKAQMIIIDIKRSEGSAG
jgi:single-stranded-DNA-specific exonuclease